MSLPVDAGDFRLLDRAVVDTLKELREANRYLRGLVAWVGYEQTAVEYERDARFAGSTNFTFRKMARFAMDGVTSFSEKPLRLATQIGLGTTAAALLLALTIVVRKAVSPDFAVAGWASLMTGVALLGGVQLLSVGVLGEYVGRIYRETKNRPLFVVAEEIGSRCHDAGERDHEREDGEARRGDHGHPAGRQVG
ncbi:MAG TPA: hypothetical protein VFV35_05110 [Acidimicrobiales bacterium]|nr:hypothetical protein [Acidimicrobiales bacterium]